MTDYIALALECGASLGWTEVNTGDTNVKEGHESVVFSLDELRAFAARIKAPQAAEPIGQFSEWDRVLFTLIDNYVEHSTSGEDEDGDDAKDAYDALKTHLKTRPLAPQAPAAQPLTPERVREAMEESWWSSAGRTAFTERKLEEFARAIEEAHGIGIAPSAQGEPK